MGKVLMPKASGPRSNSGDLTRTLPKTCTLLILNTPPSFSWGFWFVVEQPTVTGL